MVKINRQQIRAYFSVLFSGGTSHPDRALTLTNAADALLVMGDLATASANLQEAERIAAVLLPPDAGLVSAMNLRLVMFSLLTGDETGAVERLRTIAGARQAPYYRDSLSKATSDFEMLAWALLRNAEEPSPEVTDEAIRALQWSQNSQSAQAVSDEGLSGLARAFFAAAAQSIMVTQWAVHASSAVEISTGLFQERQAAPDCVSLCGILGGAGSVTSARTCRVVMPEGRTGLRS